MNPQTRKTVLNRIKNYLRKNPTELKGVRSFKKDRLNALIQRLDEFSPIETLRWNVPDRKLFRDVAVAAGIHFVRQYPSLYHTPNSLRACFGMPTRTDRKKGRFSSIYFRNEAFERQLRPRTEDLDELQTIINNKEQFKNEVAILNRYIENAKQRGYIDDLLEAPESDHSNKSIDNLRLFLEQYDFSDLQEASEAVEEDEDRLQDLNGVVLAPDLIGSWKEKECWIELKEYRELKFNSKVVFQVFRYLYQNPFVILISISPLPSFVQLLEQKNWNAESLHNWGFKHQTRMQADLSRWNETRDSYKKLGRSFELTPRQETLLLTLTNEIVTREIGLISTELRGIEKFLDLVSNFEEEILIQDFDQFMLEYNEIPSTPCLLIKMDYSTPNNN
ncbi:MAG: hypothetical protein ACFE95_06235 [Candidatus Hodarchaeota archaeon]